MAEWSHQRCWDDVDVGDEIGRVEFPLSVYRLVVAAGANRDFNSIHHNTEFARATGADEMYANTIFLMGMWERLVREYIGLDGVIRRIGSFRMGRFNYAGDTVVVSGSVARKWREGDDHFLELTVQSHNGRELSVGPGTVVVTLPSRA